MRLHFRMITFLKFISLAALLFPGCVCKSKISDKFKKGTQPQNNDNSEVSLLPIKEWLAKISDPLLECVHSKHEHIVGQYLTTRILPK